MKTKKILSSLALFSFCLSQTLAVWIPAEPMTIYWKIDWKSLPDTAILEITNNWKILNSSKIVSNKYWTNKTFDLDNKINIEKFNWKLDFSVKDWNKKIEVWEIELWEINICDKNPIFQKGLLCQYNLFLKNINLSSEEKKKEEERQRKIEEEKKRKLEEKLNKNFWKLNLKDKLPLNFWKEKFLVKKEKLNKKINFSTKEIIISGEKVKIKDELQRDLLLIWDSWKKELFLHIPKKARLFQKNIEIDPPKLIEFKQIEKKLQKRKIKKIIWAVEIPTSKKLQFSDKIEICIPTDRKTTSNLQVFFSHDLLAWDIDSNASDLKIKDSSLCFKTNHLTWFAIWEVESNWLWTAKWIDVCPNNIDNSWDRYDWKCGKDEMIQKENTTKNIVKTTQKTVEMKKIVKKEDSISKILWDFFWDNNIKQEKNTFTEQKTNNVTKKDYSISPKTYKNYLNTVKTKEIISNVYWFNIVILNWEKEYNLKTLKKVKEINSNYNKKYYKNLLIEYLNSVTTSYGFYKEALANNNWIKWFAKTYNFKTYSLKIKENIFRALDSWRMKANTISGWMSKF